MKEKWTWDNIPDLTGKVIIVTGGNSGLGYNTVKSFAEKGATIILASRFIERGQRAKSRMRKKTGNGTIEVMELDLAHLKSVKEFAVEFQKKYQKLDILVNNAGIMTTPYFKTKDSFEGQMGTNHLGHFALTGKLWPVLKRTPGSRVVNVSSNGHRSGKMDFNNLLFEDGKGYGPMKAYGRSKLANLLFTYELQRRINKAGLDIKALAAHPGGSKTNLGRHILKSPIFFLFLPILIIMIPIYLIMIQSAAKGALPQIRAAVDPGVKGGEYFGPGGPGEIRGYPVRVKSNQASHNQDDAKKLWEISEQLTGINFTV